MTTAARYTELREERNNCGCEICLSALSLRAWRNLHYGGYQRIIDIAESERNGALELLRIPNFGKSCLREVRRMIRVWWMT